MSDTIAENGYGEGETITPTAIVSLADKAFDALHSPGITDAVTCTFLASRMQRVLDEEAHTERLTEQLVSKYDVFELKGRSFPPEGHIDFLGEYALVLRCASGKDSTLLIKWYIDQLEAQSTYNPTSSAAGRGKAAHLESAGQYRIEDLLRKVSNRCETLTAITERYHVDPSFRDVYYFYYSKKFRDVNRFSIRVSLFDCEIDKNRLLFDNENNRIQESFIGSFVVDPINEGLLGRTLINPRYLIESDSCIRCSDYEFHVRGITLAVEAFPFRMQDGEAMRCAEISLLNLMCYYSNQYHDYQPMGFSRPCSLHKR